VRKWTIRLSLIGLVAGLIFATLNFGYIYKSFDDVMALLQICLPFLLIGLLLGMFVDFISVSSEDKKILKNNSINSSRGESLSSVSIDNDDILEAIVKEYNGDKEESSSDVFENYANLILQKSNVKNTDANLLKATVYLCFAQISCLNFATQGKSSVFIDNMVEDAKNSILKLKMRVKELAQSDDELERILSNFPAEADVDGDTNINGLAAWNAIYFTYVEEVVLEISNKSKGPLGPYGYAAIKVLEALRGKGQGKDDFMDVSFLITEMTGKVIKSFR